MLCAIAGVWSAIGLDIDAPPNALRGDVIMVIGTAFSAAYTVFAKRYVMKYDGVAMTALVDAVRIFCAFHHRDDIW